jgi:hypothetical protein
MHSKAHVRNAFLEAVDAHEAWEPNEPEPTVEFKQIAISKACGLVWRSTDILPHLAVQGLVANCGLELWSRTYASAAHALKAAIDNEHRGRSGETR